MAAGQEAEQKPWEAALPVNAQSHFSILALSPVATEGTVLSCASQDSGSLPIMQATPLLAGKTGPQKTAGLVTATTSTGEVGAPEAAPSPPTPTLHPASPNALQFPCCCLSCVHLDKGQSLPLERLPSPLRILRPHAL